MGIVGGLGVAAAVIAPAALGVKFGIDLQADPSVDKNDRGVITDLGAVAPRAGIVALAGALPAAAMVGANLLGKRPAFAGNAQSAAVIGAIGIVAGAATVMFGGVDKT